MAKETGDDTADEDLTPDTPALPLDDIEQFDRKVDRHDDVEEDADGDEPEATQEATAPADAAVTEQGE